MNDGGVMDALSMWLKENKNVYVVQTLVCVNKEWQRTLSDCIFDTCDRAFGICSKLV